MAFDVFLEIDGIPGESTDDKYPDQIEVLSYSHGLSQPTSGISRSSGGAASGERCNHGDFTVVHSLDKASPKLVEKMCKGEHIATVNVHLCRATSDKTEYMTYEMKNVLVTSLQTGGSASGEYALPLETITFNYGEMKWKYTETDHETGSSKGSVEFGWSVVKNTSA